MWKRMGLLEGTVALGILLGAGMQGAAPASGFPVAVRGSVVDAEERPLADVAIRVFIEGLVEAEVRTDPDGTYEVRFSVDPNREETVLLYCVPPRVDQAPDLALVRESREDRSAGIWSPCVRRLGIRPSLEWTARIESRMGLVERLARSGCAGS
ncbi:MAG: hypothetical protein GF346_12860 [Candidatus Eisenbacteria bacterium]|nr:hypothetical protein [Candidatus Latescibacterota bacterium]MBD3303328.1 hypothetical protein [Candidatus Eisenbacteria bacterium]